LLYDFNLLVSYGWGSWHSARHEVLSLLGTFGDARPDIGRTLARGVAGVRTSLNNRQVIRSLAEAFQFDPSLVRYTLKWTPIDLWCEATMGSMKKSLASLKDSIGPNETWMMHIEKRRFTALHKAEMIKELADLIDSKVDLEDPDKIVWIELLGNQAGMSVVRPKEIFSQRMVGAPR
jgi:tRNA acetyltransferase TAN1